MEHDLTVSERLVQRFSASLAKLRIQSTAIPEKSNSKNNRQIMKIQ